MIKGNVFQPVASGYRSINGKYQATCEYSRLSIIRAWFNRFAAQPRQCIFKEKFLFSVSITFV
jgi:hypothetical protein